MLIDPAYVLFETDHWQLNHHLTSRLAGYLMLGAKAPVDSLRQFPRETFKVIQHGLAIPASGECGQHEQRTDFVVVQVKHAGGYRLIVKPTQIKRFVHQCAVAVLGFATRPECHLFSGVGADALAADGFAADVKSSDCVVEGRAFYFQH